MTSSSTHCLFPAISPGATIGVLAFGSPLSEQRMLLGVAELERRGYSVRMPLPVHEYYGRYDHGFTNGSVEQRISAFTSLLSDPEVAAILSARGGFGLMELLPELATDLVKKATKPIVGLSDTTVLLAQTRNSFSAPMIHGPSLGDAFADAASNDEARRSVDSLCSLWHERPWSYRASVEVLRGGRGQGELLVGNLSMFCALLGTPWDVSFDGAVLVLEEVGESPYRVHRSLLQLALAGKFSKLNGLAFGRFAKCTAGHGPSLSEVLQLALRTYLRDLSFPVVAGLAVGHWGENQALPLGACSVIEDTSFRVE